MKLTVAAGARIEILAVSGVVSALREAGHEVRLIGPRVESRAAGPELAERAVTPDASWELPEDMAGRATRALAFATGELTESRPDVALVLGSTATAIAIATAARQLEVGVTLLDDGWRSFDERSGAETARRRLTALATLHLVPTRTAASCLAAEGVPAERVRVVGSPRVDTILASGVARVRLEERRGTLLAVGGPRPEDRDRVDELVRLLPWLVGTAGPVTLLLQARTEQWLRDAGIHEGVASLMGVRIAHRLPYPELLRAVAASELVVADSSGLVEEASFFGIPSVLLRTSTSRTESVNAGSAALSGIGAGEVLEAVDRFLDPRERKRIDGLPCLYGDGRAAERIAQLFGDAEISRLLTIADPEPVAR